MSTALGELFTNIASAIRDKTGDTATMKPMEFPEKIEGIELSSSGGNLKVANGTFLGVGTSGDAVVNHNLGIIPDIVIIADADSLAGLTLSFGMVYFMAGMSQALADLTTFDFCQFGAAYGLNAWTSVSNPKDITATSDAVINNTTATHFKVGGGYGTMPNKTYRWLAIAGLT